MMKVEKFLLLVSDSTHYVMKLEKLLQNSQICCRIIPLPREVSAGCGLSIRAELSDKEIIEKILKDNEIEVTKYLIEKEGLKKRVEKI
ncbi:DUF3343 domain-containing protein [Fusobacterium mortiferum]|uniref:DUF3343 domain-containing protein n=3 Tax=Fusobacterium mortiferum TaxID=850 RepID=A0A414PY31_FUSMR|nr:DUF3343 domain-containing protein [Fusobacterium mortiferum ATCC 9817]MCF2627096.1 DUF3343 domain-containing protein [Fusobacterium mortiferum]MCF2698436.1 DUF3343 domain-containing protein [Fusobacterium mortiferum]RGN00242.1 DUF3343 domain-containing protein [Fusobacterium mortiferum]RHF67322.1 DUF3343 domain-containing protein [Fusobacterium mortiferum]